MRTWKQGRIGSIRHKETQTLYVRLLKYPLAQFYIQYNNLDGIKIRHVLEVNIHTSVLRYIETVGQEKISRKDKEKICIEEKIYKIEELQSKLEEVLKDNM